MNLFLRVSLFILASCFFTSVMAQGNQAVNGGTTLPSKKSGISGTIVSSFNPVMGAMVKVSGMVGNQPIRLQSFTNEKGMFKLGGLAPSTYAIQVTKPGFLVRDPQTNNPLVLADGVEARIQVEMVKAGVIEGKVVDTDANPVAGISVTALLETNESKGAASAQSGASVLTDDKGHYRIYGLQPGTYHVALNLRDTTEVWSKFGRFYYPDKRELVQASAIVVGLSQEVDDLNFKLNLESTTTYSVSGRVTLEGANLQAPIALRLSKVGDQNVQQTMQTDDEGNYKFSGLTPGTYRLRSQNDPRRVFVSALQEFVVVNESVTSLDVDLQKAATLQGKSVLIDKGTERPYSKIRISLHVSQRDGGVIACRYTKEGEFEGTIITRELNTGARVPFVWRFSEWPEDIYLKTITLKNVDVTFDRLELKADEPVTGIKLTFSTSAASIEGHLDQSSSLKTGDRFGVYVFPAESKKFASALFNRHAVIASDGVFNIKNLRPGRYFVVSVRLDPQLPDAPIRVDTIREAMASGVLGPKQIVVVTEGERKKGVIPVRL